MSEWNEIAWENLKAAQVLADGGFARSCSSRTYAPAFSAVTFALKELAPFDRGRETPPHHKVVSLVKEHLLAAGASGPSRALTAALRRLYNNRIDADYRAGVTVDPPVALSARRDAHEVCRDLGILDASGH